MSKKRFALILIIKVQGLCNDIKNYYKVSFEEARNMLYKSKLYKSLENESIKMWYFSNFYLFNMFKEERETGDFTVYNG